MDITKKVLKVHTSSILLTTTKYGIAHNKQCHNKIEGLWKLKLTKLFNLGPIWLVGCWVKERKKEKQEKRCEQTQQDWYADSAAE